MHSRHCRQAFSGPAESTTRRNDEKDAQECSCTEVRSDAESAHTEAESAHRLSRGRTRRPLSRRAGREGTKTNQPNAALPLPAPYRRRPPRIREDEADG